MQNKAYALNIGLNHVDPISYREWDGKLNSCEADACAMNKIAVDLGYEKPKLLLTADATKDAFFKEVAVIRKQLNPGDLFLLSFSGHGGQVLDTSGDEDNGYDETWCFYDGQVLDDEIHELLKTFEKGVHILVVSDSCFSGTIIKDPDETMMVWGRSIEIDLPGVEASVRLISSSQEFELSREARNNGLFTTALLKVWDNGSFDGDYIDFYKAIVSHMPFHKNQTPNYIVGGGVEELRNKNRPFMV